MFIYGYMLRCFEEEVNKNGEECYIEFDNRWYIC